jgi:hypothetical protein
VSATPKREWNEDGWGEPKGDSYPDPADRWEGWPDPPMRIDSLPRCDCGHLFEICDHPNCPCGEQRSKEGGK